jgi:DUF1680 family protein
VAKFYEVSPDPEYLTALESAWKDIYNYHLTHEGGPWGGIGKHKECFNSKNFFSPYGYVETCSIMAWIQFNKQMLRLTGKAIYAQEIEKAAYNALLGAKYSNGVDWCYHSFPNGRLHVAHFNDCCPSSGALALEELSTCVYSTRGNGIACNLYTESKANLELGSGQKVRIVQSTNYPFEGQIRITLFPEIPANFPVFLRIPDWADDAVISINGKELEIQGETQGETHGRASLQGEYCKIDHFWKGNDQIEIRFPFDIKIINRSENADAPQGGKSLYQVDWFALTRGPLVYAANGLIFGKEREEVITLPKDHPESLFTVGASKEDGGNPIELKLPDNSSILFLPYYRAGGRKEGAWRLTWIQKEIN